MESLDLILFVVNSTNRVSNTDVVFSIALKHLVKAWNGSKVAFCFTRCGSSKWTEANGLAHVD